jgi:hypothetical protein
MNPPTSSNQALVWPQCGGTMDEDFVGEDRRAVCQYCRSKIDLPDSIQPIQMIPVPVTAPNKDSTLATISMVAGILGLLNFFPLLGSLAAILVGREALKKIRWEPELYTGEKNARLGITLGWIGLGINALFLCFMIGGNILQLLLNQINQLR